MRLSPYFVVAPALFASGVATAKVDVQHRGQQTVYTVAVEGVQFENVTVAGQPYQVAHLAGVAGYEAVDYQVGAPELPVVRFYVRGDAVVTAGHAARTGMLASGAHLKPNLPPHLKVPGVREHLIVSSAAYGSATMSPSAQLFRIDPAGTDHGVAQSLVTLYPFAYAPATGRYALRSDFQVTVTTPRQVDDSNGHEIFAFVVSPALKGSPSLTQYENLKAELGYEVQEIDVTAQDTPDTIRAALQKLYARTDAKLRYALIIGKDVPAYTSKNISGLTDHYYRSLEAGDYETNIDSPSIGVGRVAVTSEEQLAIVLGKYTRYQAAGFTSETWLGNVSFVATDDNYTVAEGTHNYVVETYTNKAGYLGNFPAANAPGGDKLYAITNKATSANVLDMVGAGRTIVDYSGHGSQTSWAGPEVTQDDVRGLKDPNALPFVIGNACDTGDFRVDESFGETWQRHVNGAITYWGSMDSTFWEEDDILERAMFDGIYRDGNRTFDKVTTAAQAELWRHYGGASNSKYYWETYVTFGDPSLELRTTQTRVRHRRRPGDPAGRRRDRHLQRSAKTKEGEDQSPGRASRSPRTRGPLR